MNKEYFRTISTKYIQEIQVELKNFVNFLPPANRERIQKFVLKCLQMRLTNIEYYQRSHEEKKTSLEE
jgi:hypothetical protein